MSQETIFLSASVPDPNADHYVRPSDSISVSAAVKALIYVILGRRKLVWGGHPAITPMIWSVAESVGVDYGAWVTLYQSNHFKDRFPQDNERFGNVNFTKEIIPEDDSGISQIRFASLQHMRERMFAQHKFAAAVFIGGMRGVIEEFEMLIEMHPNIRCIPIISSGGVTELIAERLIMADQRRLRLARDVDYIPLFYDLLEISPSERRLNRPEEEPM